MVTGSCGLLVLRRCGAYIVMPRGTLSIAACADYNKLLRNSCPATWHKWLVAAALPDPMQCYRIPGMRDMVPSKIEDETRLWRDCCTCNLADHRILQPQPQPTGRQATCPAWPHCNSTQAIALQRHMVATLARVPGHSQPCHYIRITRRAPYTASTSATTAPTTATLSPVAGHCCIIWPPAALPEASSAAAAVPGPASNPAAFLATAAVQRQAPQ